MGNELPQDIEERFVRSHEIGMCVAPTSAADDQRLRRLRQRGLLESPAKKVYALPELWSQLNPLEQERHKLIALAQLHPSWVFASFSAAVLLGFDVSYGLLGTTHIACDRKTHSSSSPGVERHIMKVRSPVWTGNAYVTSVERTVFDCTRSATFPLALGIADSALRTRDLSKEQFVHAFEQEHSNIINKWRAVEIMSYADGLAENGGESYARAVMIRQGYRIPELQVEIPDPIDSDSLFRVDFLWKLRTGDVIGELDGTEKYTNPVMTNGKSILDVMRDERLRESHLTGTGAKVMRFSFDNVLDTKKLCHIMDGYGIPSGYPVPEVAVT